MAKNPVQHWVLVLERDKIKIFHPAIKNIVEAPIPDTVIKDLEIKKVADLEKIIIPLLLQIKIPSGDPVFVILGESTVLPERIPDTNKQMAKEKIDEAIKMAPFNHVGWTSLQNGRDLIVIIINRELYEGVQEILERNGYPVASVTPSVTLGLPAGQFSTGIGEDILRKSALVRQNSLIFDPEQAIQAENNVSSDPRKNRKLLWLLLVLTLLVLVLGGVVAKSFLFPDKPAQTLTPTPAPTETVVSEVPTPTEIPSVAPTETASPSALFDSVKIQILNGSGQAGALETSRQNLTSAGFKNITAGNSSVVNSPRIQIVFSPSLSSEVRQAIISSLSGSYPNPATREEPNTSFDAVITLTNPN